jgi:hypothetical protein
VSTLKKLRKIATTRATPAAAKERLRELYRPSRVHILFIGEAPPASGRFFYQADSELYRAIRDSFARAVLAPHKDDFLRSFRAAGCYLVDLCGKPVDRLNDVARRRARREGEARLVKILRRLRPKIVVVVIRSITASVRRAETAAKWAGTRVELPYPGRWHRYRGVFVEELSVFLRKQLQRRGQ